MWKATQPLVRILSTELGTSSQSNSVDSHFHPAKGYPWIRLLLHQFPSKIAIASATEAPLQMIAWQASVIRTASSVVRW